MARLTVNPDTADAWVIELRDGKNSIGSGEANDFPLAHPSISDLHCEITVMKSGVLLKDLGSANGSHINDTPVEESLILPGQVFRLGDVWLRLEAAVQPPVLNPASNIPPPSSGTFCKTHPKAAARYYCSNCKELFCDLCVVTRLVDGETKRSCRACRGECVPQATEETQAPPIFASEVPGAFIFPFQEDGLFVLIAGAVFYSLLAFASRFLFFIGLAVMVGLTGYMVAYLQSIITTSALGRNRVPGWPDFSDYTDLFGPFWQSLCTVIVSFGPALGLSFALFHYEFTLRTNPPPWIAWALLPAVAWGCIYYPMGFLAVTMFDSIGALNPLVIIPSIFRIFWAYSLAVLLCAIIYMANRFGALLLATVLPLPIVTTLIIQFISLYLAMVTARLLGLLYWTKKSELGWFRH